MSLRDRLRQWIVKVASEEVADCFSPLLESTLQDAGYDLSAPVSKEQAQEVRAQLRAADITPARMERALRESRRAAGRGQSALQWCRSVQARAHGEELAEKTLTWARAKLKEKEDAGLQRPPTPQEAFAFLLAWEELGGSSGVAAIRELQRRSGGEPPSN